MSSAGWQLMCHLLSWVCTNGTADRSLIPARRGGSEHSPGAGCHYTWSDTGSADWADQALSDWRARFVAYREPRSLMECAGVLSLIVSPPRRFVDEVGHSRTRAFGSARAHERRIVEARVAD